MKEAVVCVQVLDADDASSISDDSDFGDKVCSLPSHHACRLLVPSSGTDLADLCMSAWLAHHAQTSTQDEVP